MSRVGHDDLLALHVATRTMIVVDGHQTRQFTMSTSIGLKGEVSKTREFAERLFQERHHCQRALYSLSRLLGVQILELGQGSHLLVDLRIVLHRTRTQGIETRIDTKVIVRQVRIVSYHRQFVALGQLCVFSTLHRCRNLVVTKVILGQTIALTTLLGELENQVSV